MNAYRGGVKHNVRHRLTRHVALAYTARCIRRRSTLRFPDTLGTDANAILLELNFGQ